MVPLSKVNALTDPPPGKQKEVRKNPKKDYEKQKARRKAYKDAHDAQPGLLQQIADAKKEIQNLSAEVAAKDAKIAELEVTSL